MIYLAGKPFDLLRAMSFVERPALCLHPVGRGGELHMGFGDYFFTKEGSRTGLQSVDSERSRLMIRGRCFSY